MGRLFCVTSGLCLLFSLGFPGEQVVVRETEARCGNGVVEADEQCDDGNELPGDACSDGCKAAFCGDGILRADLDPGVDGAEACDDGNDVDADGCLNNCIKI